MSSGTNQMPHEILDPGYDIKQICKKDVDLSPIGNSHKLAFLLKNVFTEKECEDLIKLSEVRGYGPAYVNSGNQEILAPGYRDGGRVLIDDKEFVKILFNRISNYLPKKFDGKKLIEINERLRFLRYTEPGEKFAPHSDGSYIRPDRSAATLITLQIYLNQGFEGGETTFLQREWDDVHSKVLTNNRVPIVPETGMILVFEHRIMHEGSEMKSGKKYTIRTDVLYTY